MLSRLNSLWTRNYNILPRFLPPLFGLKIAIRHPFIYSHILRTKIILRVRWWFLFLIYYRLLSWIRWLYFFSLILIIIWILISLVFVILNFVSRAYVLIVVWFIPTIIIDFIRIRTNDFSFFDVSLFSFLSMINILESLILLLNGCGGRGILFSQLVSLPNLFDILFVVRLFYYPCTSSQMH